MSVLSDKKVFIDKIGFSIYTPEETDFLLQNFDFDLTTIFN